MTEPGQTIYRSLGEGGVPMLLIDDLTLRGFDKQALADALRSRGITPDTGMQTANVTLRPPTH